MTSFGYALARAELIRVLTAYTGIATSDGEADGTTLFDINLKDNPAISASAIPEKTILIMSGPAAQEDKGAASFVNATGKITLQGTGFSTQIKAGTIFRILNISSVEIDVETINTKVGTNADAAGTNTLFARLRQIVDTYLASAAHGLAKIVNAIADLITRTKGLDDIHDDLAGVVTDADPKVVGRAQIKATTHDLQQAAATRDLVTGTTQDVLIESLALRCPVNCSDDAGAFTGISIQTDDATAQVFISQADGVKVNLTQDAQLAWTGIILLKATKKIQLTIYGGAADDPTVCDIVVKCRAAVSGGYLA